MKEVYQRYYGVQLSSLNTCSYRCIDSVPFKSGKIEVKVKVTCQPASAKPSCSCVYFSYLIRLMGVPVRFVTCSEIRHNEDVTPGNGTEPLL